MVLFLFAWALMASLIVEQGRTIESQRWLIQSLFQDSSKLFQKRQAEVKAQAEARVRSQVQTPSTQEKSQDQAKQTDPNQDQARQSQAKNSHTSKLRKAPPRPPTDADTLADERRVLLTI